MFLVQLVRFLRQGYNRIKDALYNILQRVRNAYRFAKPQSREAQIIAQMKDIIEPAYEIYVRGYTNAARNLRNMEGRVSGSTKLQSRYAKQGGEFSDALTGAEWTKYNHAMSTNADAGLRISDNSILVECEEDSDYQYKYVVYDNTFEDNPIKSVYAIGNIDYTIDDANMVANELHKLEESGYEQKYAKKILRSIAKVHKILLGEYNSKSSAFSRIGNYTSQSGANPQSQPNGTGISGGVEQTGIVKYQPRIDTPEFKRWFGNSKVVDENGEPLVVYHGTSADFTKFERGDIGYHVGALAQAKDRVRGVDGAKVMSLYASIQNPLEIGMDYGDWHGTNTAIMLLETEVFEDRPDVEAKLRKILEIDRAKGGLSAAKRKDVAVRKLLQSLGYDGIRYVNTFEGENRYSGDNYSYIAFESGQLKSAADNIGTFDRSNPDIRYQERSQDYDFSDFGFDLIEDDGSIENSFAREYSKHSEDIGEVLKNIAAIDIAPSKVESIIKRVVRNSLGGIGTLAFDSNILHWSAEHKRGLLSESSFALLWWRLFALALSM